MLLSWGALKQLLWKIFLVDVISTYKNLPKHWIFADSLLIVSYIQSVLQKELLIAPFIEPFKNADLEKSYNYLEQFTKTLLLSQIFADRR